MSYLSDKVQCKGGCGLLYDADLLNEQGECRDCVSDKAELADLQRDSQTESWPRGHWPGRLA